MWKEEYGNQTLNHLLNQITIIQFFDIIHFYLCSTLYLCSGVKGIVWMMIEI